MSRRSFSLLILAILLCCHGWAVGLQDVLLAQASMTEGVAQQQASMSSAGSQDHDSSSQHHGDASDTPDLDDTVILGLLEFRSTTVSTAGRYYACSSGGLPFRWLERPMRPPSQAPLLT